MVEWQAPPHGFAKLNVDGAVDLRRKTSSCGGIVRNRDGLVLGGFTCNIGYCSVIETELWAIYHGLNYAWDSGIRNLILESDSANAVKLVKSRVSAAHPLAHLVCGICNLLHRDWTVFISHILQEGNQAADLCAVKGQNDCISLHLFSLPPLEFEQVLKEDREGPEGVYTPKSLQDVISFCFVSSLATIKKRG